MTEQNAYFDNLYRAGHSHAKNKFQEDYAGAFNNSMEGAKLYLKSSGFDVTQPIENLSILDAACGSGWVTAGLCKTRTFLTVGFMPSIFRPMDQRCWQDLKGDINHQTALKCQLKMPKQ